MISKSTWLRITILTMLVVSLGFSKCRTHNTANETIRIGAISPFTGDGANYGKAARTAINMAVDEINNAGGIHGKKLEVLYEDDKGSPRDALSAFQKLMNVNKVPAVLGPFYSGNVLACAPEAERNRVVLLTGSATSDNVRNAGDYIFRVCPSNDTQSKTIADFAMNKLSLRSAFIIYRNVDYGVTLRDAFDKAYRSIGGSIVGTEAVPADATDVRAQLVKVKAAKPSFVFAAVHYTEGGTLLRQAKELGINSIVIGTDGGYDPQLLTIGGSAAEGSYWVTVGWGDETSNPAVSKFKQAYVKRYGEEPGAYSGLYYDATHVLARAISGADVLDGPSIQRQLQNIHDYEGPTGITNFDSFGDVDKPFAIYQVKDGRFVPVSAILNPKE
jgi:branched-chain amino acid transport system substrate-binding protein